MTFRIDQLHLNPGNYFLGLWLAGRGQTILDYIESGVEAILVSASGCGVSVKDYAEMLANDAEYAHKATVISELYRDPVELIEKEIEKFDLPEAKRSRVAFHTTGRSRRR